MLAVLAFIIVFHIVALVLLFISAINNVRSCSHQPPGSHGAVETSDQGGEWGGCDCDPGVSSLLRHLPSPGLGALILGLELWEHPVLRFG